MSHFSTADGHAGRWHQPVRVPVNKTDAFGAAQEMVADLPGWGDLKVDADALSFTCHRTGGLLFKSSEIRIWCEGPDGIPSSETHCESKGGSGLLSRDKANVAEFTRKLYMRIT